jgi:DUF1365 family protein
VTGTLTTATPRLYECRVSHTRRTPVRNAFTYRTCLWLVDLDDLPRPSRLAAFEGRDHLGDPTRPIRANVDAFLRGHDIDLGGGQVLMLAHARMLGYVFNPLTLFWCHRADGALACVIAEVHNTYGQRHAYLLRTDDRGRARVPKEFYVSPFYPVDGSYRMSVPRPGPRLALSVRLDRPDGTRFTACVHGTATRPGTWPAVRAALRHPWPPAVVAVRIRWQGVKLYLHGLRPVPRPPHLPQKGVQ